MKLAPDCCAQTGPFAGVIMLVGIDVAGRRSELIGALEILLSAFFYAVGPMVLKRHLPDMDPLASMGTSLLIAAVFLTPVALIAPPHTVPPPSAIAALAGLGVLCTAAAFVAYAVLIREAGAGRALVITYINPIIAVAVGMALRGERPGMGAVLGLAVILLGSWLSTEAGRPTQAPEIAHAQPGERAAERAKYGVSD